MGSRSVDRLMLLTGMILMAVSSYQLFFKGESSGEGAVLGELSGAFSVVKIKHALNLGWKDAGIGHPITENELLFTEEEASAEISFRDGGKLEVGENSLIRVSLLNKETSLNVERGIFRAKLEGARPLRLEMNGEGYELSGDGAEIQVNLRNRKGEIGVVSGEVRVESAGTKAEINPEVLLVVNERGMEKKRVPFKLDAPKFNQNFFMTGTELPVTFSWSPALEGKIKVGNNPQLEGAREFTAGPGLSLNLSPGMYYWKVESGDGSSLVGSFRVKAEQPPEIKRPLDGEEVILKAADEEASDLVLQWQGERGRPYRLEWDAGKGTEGRSVKGSSSVVEVGQSGTFRWRVRLEQQERPLALWSPWQNVTVNRLPPPSTPENLLPDGVEYQSYSAPDEKVELSWRSEGPVELELLSPKGNKTFKAIPANKFEVRATEAGGYRWRLRSVDSFNRRSGWSEWKSWQIVDLTGSEVQGAQKIQLKRPDQQVEFKWENPGADETTFELARDADFKTVVVKRKLQGDSTKTVIPEVGIYYWRSRQIRTDGRVNFSGPVRVIIEPAPAPGKPQKLPDVEVPIEWKVIDEKSTWNVIDFIFPSAFADQMMGTVKLKLPKGEDDKAVLIRIYRDEGLKELILEKNLAEGDFSWEEARPGNYYWQYAVIDHWDRRGPFSDPARLTVTGEEVKPPQKPRLAFPVRAQEVEAEDLRFEWSKDGAAEGFILQVSSSHDFSRMTLEKKMKEHLFKAPAFHPPPGLYFWRVKALNSLNHETVSNTGRFIVIAPLPAEARSSHEASAKSWRPRASIAWSPSSDSYAFEDQGQTGKIEGHTLNGVELKGVAFGSKWILSAELLRQSGKVFKGQSYLFQRLTLDSTRSFDLRGGGKIGAGAGVGHSGAHGYSIIGSSVKASSVSSFSYGPFIRSFHPLSPQWELQSRLSYLLGGIRQMDIALEFIRAWKADLYFIGGVGYAGREYEEGGGKQSSTRVMIGVGKEF